MTRIAHIENSWWRTCGGNKHKLTNWRAPTLPCPHESQTSLHACGSNENVKLLPWISSQYQTCGSFDWSGLIWWILGKFQEIMNYLRFVIVETIIFFGSGNDKRGGFFSAVNWTKCHDNSSWRTDRRRNYKLTPFSVLAPHCPVSRARNSLDVHGLNGFQTIHLNQTTTLECHGGYLSITNVTPCWYERN